jgi:tetratricopeptide (TPR) repeat protein
VIRPTVTTVSCLVVAILVASSGSGCRLVQPRGPVTSDLAEARRLSNEGLSAADRSDLVRAEGLLERAVKSCPVDVDARRHYAEVLWRRGERMEAVKQIEEALRLSPADAGLCVEGGGMHLELGLFDDADRLAREAVRLAPGSAAAWHLRGRVSLARGQAEPALADFHRALAIDGDDRGLLVDTAEAYRRLDRPQRALATLAILGETYGPDQTPAEVLVMEGLAQEALGRPAEAMESYRLAIAKGNAPADAAARLGALQQAALADGSAGVIPRSTSVR